MSEQERPLSPLHEIDIFHFTERKKITEIADAQLRASESRAPAKPPSPPPPLPDVARLASKHVTVKKSMFVKAQEPVILRARPELKTVCSINDSMHKTHETISRQLKRKATGFYFAYTGVNPRSKGIYNFGDLNDCTPTFMDEFPEFRFCFLLEINDQILIDSLVQRTIQMAKERKQYSNGYMGDLVTTDNIDDYIYCVSNMSAKLTRERDYIAVTSLIPFSSVAKSVGDLNSVAETVAKYRTNETKLKLIGSMNSIDELERLAKIMKDLEL